MVDSPMAENRQPGHRPLPVAECQLPEKRGACVLRCLSRLLFPLAFCMLPFLLASCGVPGVIAYKVLGPDAVKPQYTPPPTEPILIFAESYDNPSIASYESEELARIIARAFKEHEVAPVVDPDALTNLLSARAKAPGAPAPQSISSIGKQLGAKHVLYIDIPECRTESIGGTRLLRGVMSVRVRIVDVDTGKTLYPSDSSEGTPLTAQTPYTEIHAGTTEQALRQKLCQTLGERIARLFYAYKPDEVEPES